MAADLTGATVPGSAAASPPRWSRCCSPLAFPALLRYRPPGRAGATARGATIASPRHGTQPSDIRARTSGDAVDDRGRRPSRPSWSRSAAGCGLTARTASTILDGYGRDEICARLAPARSWRRGPTGSATGGTRSTGQPLPAGADRAGPAQRDPRPGQLGRAGTLRRAVAPDAVTLEYDLPPQPGYPWPLLLRTRWTVGAGRAARRATRRPTPATEPCPFGLARSTRTCGCPAWPSTTSLLQVPGRSRLLADGRLLPIGAAKVAGTEYDYTEPRRIGAAVLDTAFGDLDRDADGGSAVHPVRAGRRGAVAVWADAAFGWWQVFTGDTLHGERYRRSVAIEPMTCPPDAFRSGRDLIVLEPGQTWRGDLGHPARPAVTDGVRRGRPAAADGAQLRPGPAGAGRGRWTGCSTTRSGRRRPASRRAGASWCWRSRPTATGSGRRPRPSDGGRTSWLDGHAARAADRRAARPTSRSTWTGTPSRTRAGPTATRPAGRCRTGTSTPGSPRLLMLLTAVDEGLGACFFGIPPERTRRLPGGVRRAGRVHADRRASPSGTARPTRRSPSLRAGAPAGRRGGAPRTVVRN